MNSTTEQRVLARALYEIRILLAGYLGSDVKADMPVRIAAHLAHALHNEAAAVVDGNGFDVKAALAKLEAIDRILNVTDGTRLSQELTKRKA